MIKKRVRMGRPPAKWVYKMLNLQIPDNFWMDKHELSDLLGVPVLSVKEFMPKLGLAKKYELEDGTIRVKYKYNDIKKAVKEYVAPWPIETIN